MTDDALSAAINPDELREFEKRHPALREAMGHLQTTLGEAFLREMKPKLDKPAALQLVVFFLGHQAVDDFYDIVLLAVHGYGVGALKLLRPLYERVVTGVYLMKYPDVHSWRVLQDAKTRGVDVTRWVSADQLAEVEAAYERVKKRFKKRGSWTTKHLKRLADEAGLGDFYGGGWFWPTMLLHTTRVALEERLTVSIDGSLAFSHEPKRDQADRALAYAHILIVQHLYACNQFFEWGIDMVRVLHDTETCWGHIGREA